MRILVVSSMFYPQINGVTITIHDQTRKLIEKGYEAHLVTRRFPGTPFHEIFDGIHVWRTGPARLSSILTRSILILKLTALIFKLVLSMPFDIIHAYGPTATMAAKIATLGLKLPMVTTFTGPDPIWDPAIVRKAPNLVSLYMQSILMFANEVTVSTDRNRRRILKLYGTKFWKKIHVIPRGVNLALFRPLRKSPHPFRAVLFVGTICHRKGTDILVMAIPRILEKYPNTKFVFVGDRTAFQSKLDELIKNLGIRQAVIFTGPKDHTDMPRYFQIGDVLVLPSRPGGEGFGRVIIEAMAMGLPVIASRIRGPIDIISHGKNGLLIEPENPQDLAEKVIRVLEDKALAMKMGNEGEKIAREKYDLSSVIRQIEKVYKKAMKT